jgi:hypothetical protein
VRRIEERTLLDHHHAAQGVLVFRINPVNFRTRREHIEELFALLERECEAVRSRMGR